MRWKNWRKLTSTATCRSSGPRTALPTHSRSRARTKFTSCHVGVAKRGGVSTRGVRREQRGVPKIGAEGENGVGPQRWERG